MLELRGKATVSGSNGPAIGCIRFCEPCSRIDHGLNGEAHSREETFLTTFPIGEVRNVGILVESSSQSVPDVFANHGESPSICFCDDVIPDNAHGAAWRQCFDRSIHGIKCALCHRAGLFGDLTDQERFRLIPMPAIDNTGNVYVDDVPFFERIIPGNTVADHFIDARAATFWKPQIPQGGWGMLVRDRVVMDQTIDFTRGDPGLNKASDVIHELSIELPSQPHSLALDFRELEFSGILEHRLE